MPLFSRRNPYLTGGLLAIAALCIGSALWRLTPRPAVPALAPWLRTQTAAFSPAAPVTVVVDPGHGGEDGGAVSPDGVEESGINLDIALRLRDVFLFLGQGVLLTREADCSLGDSSLETVRQRKASDIRRRVELVNGAENAVLISVHQNSLPSSPVTYGAQVFWNREAGGQDLAEEIQDALNGVVNHGHEKQAREIDRTIYLMRHAAVPAALAECGFLSNEADTARLQTADWQREIAVALAAGAVRFLSHGQVM